MNINRINSFVIERAFDFITILSEDFPRHRNKHCFHELFPAYDIIDRIPELLSFVYMSRIHYFCEFLFCFLIIIFFPSGQ